MLSEHEIIELLEQLKLGALQGVASESDPVGHWPVLVGDGLCLSLQSAAMAEFARQPDKVTVIGGVSPTTTLAGLCSQYRQVHHASTGLYNRSLLIAYDSECLSLLPLLHRAQSAPELNSCREDEQNYSCIAYDFSLAIAASLDPAAHIDGVNHPVAFLPLEFEDHTRVAGGWRIAIEVGAVCAEFFIGLLNPEVQWEESQPVVESATALIAVQPQSVSRAVNANEISIKLGMPELLEWHQPLESEMYRISLAEGGGIEFQKEEESLRATFSADTDLMVQRSLQLSVDDLYLLLVEALGGGAKLKIVFEVDADDHLHDDQLTYVFPINRKLRCVKINGLPVRHADIVFDGVDFMLKSYE